jgi:hypothetical protein
MPEVRAHRARHKKGVFMGTCWLRLKKSPENADMKDLDVVSYDRLRPAYQDLGMPIIQEGDR